MPAVLDQDAPFTRSSNRNQTLNPMQVPACRLLLVFGMPDFVRAFATLYFVRFYSCRGDEIRVL